MYKIVLCVKRSVEENWELLKEKYETKQQADNDMFEFVENNSNVIKGIVCEVLK